MDINKEIQTASDKIIAEKLPAMVEKATTLMLEKVINDVFSSYGDMAKEIKKKIEEKLDINLQKYDIVDYNAMVAQIINDNITASVNLEPIISLTKKTMGFLDIKSIDLSAIVEMFKASAMENSCDTDGRISVHIEENEHHKWVEVYLDVEENKDKHQCGIKFIVSTKSNRIFSFKHQCYSSPLGNMSPAKITSMSVLEHEIFRLYAAQVEVLVDGRNIDFDECWDKYDN